MAGGPADPGAWDAWFGDPSALSEGEAEAQARERKAAALPQELAELYEAARIIRDTTIPNVTELAELRARAGHYPEEWLLQAELNELEAGV